MSCIMNGLHQSIVLVVLILCVWYGVHGWPQSICGGQRQFYEVHSVFQIAMLAWQVPSPTEPSHQPAFEVLTKLYTSFSREKMKEVLKGKVCCKGAAVVYTRLWQMCAKYKRLARDACPLHPPLLCPFLCPRWRVLNAYSSHLSNRVLLPETPILLGLAKYVFHCQWTPQISLASCSLLASVAIGKSPNIPGSLFNSTYCASTLYQAT